VYIYTHIYNNNKKKKVHKPMWFW